MANEDANNAPQQQQTTQSTTEANPPNTDASNSDASASAPPATTVHKTDFEKDVVYLYQFSRCPTTPSPSPFCLKVETWLRIAGIKYENVDHKMKLKSKKGKLPFIELNGSEIADSVFIIRELTSHFEKDLDGCLTREEKAISHAVSEMLDNHTAWTYAWWRYNNPGDFLKSMKMNLQQALQTRIPAPILNFFFKLKMKGNKKRVMAHGIGCHKPEEIYDFATRDLDALVDLLGSKSFFFGEYPTVLDCVAFAHLLQFVTVDTDINFPPKTYLEQKCPTLVSYLDRIKGRYWPDWDEICKTLELNTHLPKKEKETKQENEDEKKKEKEGGDDEEKKKDEDQKSEGKDSDLEKKVENDEKEKEDPNKLEEKQESEEKK